MEVFQVLSLTVATGEMAYRAFSENAGSPAIMTYEPNARANISTTRLTQQLGPFSDTHTPNTLPPNIHHFPGPAQLPPHLYLGLF